MIVAEISRELDEAFERLLAVYAQFGGQNYYGWDHHADPQNFSSAMPARRGEQILVHQQRGDVGGAPLIVLNRERWRCREREPDLVLDHGAHGLNLLGRPRMRCRE